jgi:DNA-binding NarL/FixJ family response regulator
MTKLCGGRQPNGAPTNSFGEHDLSGTGNHEADPGARRSTAPEAIILVESRTLIRESLARSIETLADQGVVGVASIQDWLARDPRPSAALIILSAHTDEERTLTEDTATLAQSGVTVPVVVMSDLEALHQVLGVLKTGVRGYIPTSMPLKLALEAMRLVCAGGTYIPAESVLAARSDSGWPLPQKQAKPGPFTARQLQVVDALRRGKANKLIAYELNMCESTVKVHVRHIMKKLQARNRTEVAFKTNELLRAREIG